MKIKALFLVVALWATLATAQTVVTVNGTHIDDRDLITMVQQMTDRKSVV